MLILKTTHELIVSTYNVEILALRQQIASLQEHNALLAGVVQEVRTATETERGTLAEVARNLHTALGQATATATVILEKELAAMRQELAVERGKRELYATQLKIAQKDADWLRVLVNTTNTERATLMARAGVAVPAPQIRMQRPLDDRTGAGMSDGPPIGSGMPGPLADAWDEFSGAMEDMGDEAAERVGLRHDELGEAHFGPTATNTE
jgi:hypothetical protein